MKLTTFGVPAVAFAALALMAAPASAQQRDRGGEHGRSEGRAVPRDGGARAEAPRRNDAPRVEAPRQVAPPQVQSRQGSESRRYDGRNSGNDNGNYAPRGEGDRRYESDRRYEGHAVPRAEIRPRVDPRVYSPRFYSPRVYAPRVYAPRYYGYRPYVFRPRTRLSFGIFLGYGVPYAYTYPYPVPVYGYGAPSAPVYITPSSTLYGGITLEITPTDADVIVDGQYIGQVRDFDGMSAPLNLTAGRHRVELQAPGYAPLAFDVDVVPGQLVPYRGDLQPSY